MSAPINTANSSACCAPNCADIPITNIPGQPGAPGTPGAPGHDGSSAFTTTTASFVMPAINGVVNIAVVSSAWCANGQVVYVTTAGYFQITNLFDQTHIQIKNLGYTGNTAPGTNIVSPQQVSPGGLKGGDGGAVSTTLNAISPSVQKGDGLFDNGANAPNASVVRLAVGSDGKVLAADSTQPTGLGYKTITPNAVTDKGIPRFSGAAGTPVPLGTSLLVIDDTGAINSTPSGGNARGTSAVDLQISRAANTQVASGLFSGILSGNNNTASASFAVVAGGSSNVCSNNTTFAAGAANTASGLSSAALCTGNTASGAASFAVGNTNTASGANATAPGGAANISSGDYSACVGGHNNRATGESSTTIGYGALADKYGQEASASGIFATRGDAQRSRLMARNTTADATSTSLFLDGISLKLSVPINTSWAFTGMVIGRTSAGVNGFYQVSGGIKNNGGVTSLIGSVTVAVAVADGGWPGGSSVTITADVVSNALKIAVVGAVATSVAWVANLDLTEVSF